MERHFYIASVGEPQEKYTTDNLKRCEKYSAHIMYEATKHVGAYEDVKQHDILILKYLKKYVAYGEVTNKVTPNDPHLEGWNKFINVKKWIWFNETNHAEGISPDGVQENVISGSQYATIKQVEQPFAMNKIKAISSRSELYQEIKLDSYLELVENNYNLILTGAPGTGKTYLAKKIAMLLTATRIPKSATTILQEAIDSFIFNANKRTHVENLLNKFHTLFPKSKLNQLQLKEYCIGTGESDNFCWWIERGLQEIGYYSPGSSQSYLIYYSKSTGQYLTNGYIKRLQESDSKLSIEDLMSQLSKDLYELIQKKTYNEHFGKALTLKILNTYYPEEFFPINSEDHLDNVINLFGIQCNEKDVLNKNKAVYQFYKDMTKGKDITAFEFGDLLYSYFNIKEGKILNPQYNILSNANYELVQFHPSYDYTDFIEGLRPVEKKGQISFELKDGTFKQLCKRAHSNPDKKYAIIIDEINRGEISKIFGELFYCIEPGYRGEENRVQTQYQNLLKDKTDDPFKDGFYVPKNVYIIGTMNDIDRNVESMDFAIRRRFTWKEIKASENIGMLNCFKGDAKKIINKMTALNKKISSIEGLGNAYHIGGAYFLQLNKYLVNDAITNQSFAKLWEYHIKGLLKEYLRGMVNAEELLNELKATYDGN